MSRMWAVALLLLVAVDARYVKYDHLDMRGFDIDLDNKPCGITPEACQDLCDDMNNADPVGTPCSLAGRLVDREPIYLAPMLLR
jgi:hypothetical protein